MERSRPRRSDRFSWLTRIGLGARLIAASCLLLTLFPSLLSAQFPQYLVNDEPDGETDRSGPAMAPLKDGRFLLLWSDLSRGSEDLYSCLLSSRLERTTPPQPVNTDGSFAPHRNALLTVPGGNSTLALWISDHGGGSDLYARAFSDSTGLPLEDVAVVSRGLGIGTVLAPSAATNKNGQTLVCWADNRINQYRLYAQRLRADGSRINSNFAPVPEAATLVQRNPAVAARPDGGWILAWDQVEGAFSRVHFRMISAEGLLQGSVFTPMPDAAFDQMDPAVLVRANDFLLAWTDNRDSKSDIWGQWFGLDGHPLGAAGRLQSTPTSGREAQTTIIPGPDGTFILLWLGEINGRERSMFRCFAADGSPLGAERPMRDPPYQGILMGNGVAAPAEGGRWAIAWNDNWSMNQQVYLDLADPVTGPSGQAAPAYTQGQSAHQILPDVALFPGGKAVVVWGDARNDDYVIYGRVLDQDGNADLAPPSFRINTIPTGVHYIGEATPEDLRAYAPHVAASGIGTFVVTWAGDIGGGKVAVYGQLFDSQARPIGSNFEIALAGSGPLRSPQYDAIPAMAKDGRFAIAWRDDSAESGGDIFLLRYRASGDTIGRPILVNDREYQVSPQQNPDLAISPFNEMVVTWIDKREGGWDIFRQRVAPNGNRLDSAGDVQVNPPDSPSEDQFFPAVASSGNTIVQVWEDMPATRGLIKGRLDFMESAAAGASYSGLARRTPPVEFTVNPTRHPPGVKRPRVAMDSSGEFVVTWWDLDDGVTRVWAQRYRADGSVEGAPYIITENDSAGHHLLVRAAVNRSRIQYVWTDSRRMRGWDVYARRVNWPYNGETTPVALNAMTATATAEGVELIWSVPLAEGNPRFQVWRQEADGTQSEGRPSSGAVLLTPDGVQSQDGANYRYVDADPPSAATLAYYLELISIGGASEFFGPLLIDQTPAPEAHWQAQPNPFREQLLLSPPRAGAARLAVWDIGGRRVRMLQRLEGSTDPLQWDGRNEAGRPVPSGIYLLRPEGGRAGLAHGGSDRNEVLRVVRIR